MEIPWYEPTEISSLVEISITLQWKIPFIGGKLQSFNLVSSYDMYFRPEPFPTFGKSLYENTPWRYVHKKACRYNIRIIQCAKQFQPTPKAHSSQFYQTSVNLNLYKNKTF